MSAPIPASLSMHSLLIGTFAPMLSNLSGLLDKGTQLAQGKGFDSTVLAGARLAPDMYPLARQVQVACELARNSVARLTGQAPAPAQEPGQTIEALKGTLAATIDYLHGIPVTAFDGAETRDIEIPLPNDLVVGMNGARYLRDWALPHFYFHLVTAYDILRHNGVEIGKPDYVAHVGDAIHPRRQ
ncbi:DUF1993 family protein [Pandoraea sp.]|uniref:DUF1993 domain-containing protein n=1 Tax=Pandoraea sp. TaxID=1883445 RepID=UPI001216201D|nr:DUF1993 domain-containing protein [Pandoraea sp.]TAL55919.1 MAG: DUF1993 domain-containing protein [Pandoraea sp.]TAM20534.1 MAG: DUF1993 domain-containing protein [Pandoraea sp.]